MACELAELDPVPECWNQRHMLGLEELSAEEISLILDTADRFRKALDHGQREFPMLVGKTCVNLFFENSTRTRTSFGLAARRLAPTSSIFRRPPVASRRGRR